MKKKIKSSSQSFIWKKQIVDTKGIAGGI